MREYRGSSTCIYFNDDEAWYNIFVSVTNKRNYAQSYMWKTSAEACSVEY